MTFEEKRAVVDEFCERYFNCYPCPIYSVCKSIDPTDNTEACYNKLIELGEIKPPVDDTANPEPVEPVIEHDPVNHPSHYCREGAMECIDEMILLFGKEVVKHFCLCNAWKYRARAMNKNGEEDLKKSDWYIKKFKELSDIG